MARPNIRLTEIKRDGTQVQSVCISREDLYAGARALYELRRNNMGMISVVQVDALTKHIKKTKQIHFSKKEIAKIINQ